MSQPRQDFLLQPFNYGNGIIYDFPLDDTIVDGVYEPTPYGNSDQQHIIDIIVNAIGGIKQFPLLGFNVIQYLNSEFQTDQVFQSLSNNMKMDLYTTLLGAVQIGENGQLIININQNPANGLVSIVPNY